MNCGKVKPRRWRSSCPSGGRHSTCISFLIMQGNRRTGRLEQLSSPGSSSSNRGLIKAVTKEHKKKGDSKRQRKTNKQRETETGTERGRDRERPISTERERENKNFAKEQPRPPRYMQTKSLTKQTHRSCTFGLADEWFPASNKMRLWKKQFRNRGTEVKQRKYP